jgi:predicted glycosyltransferase
MARILVYSHDTYGLGNIRRMLAIATHLAGAVADASVLVISGSPMLQGFRIAPQVDYIKLPSVMRTEREGYATRSLGVDTPDLFELRANLVLAAVADFKPDIILVDKKPFGIAHELEAAICYARAQRPRASLVLVLRDILDEPRATMHAWTSGGYTEAIERFYDRVLVLGTPEVFDVCTEYRLPPSVARKVRYCGYIRRPRSTRDRDAVRRDLGVAPAGKLVLVTPGGGQDGDRIVQAYMDALPIVHADAAISSVIVTGPEMAARQRYAVAEAARLVPRVQVCEFTDDMMALMDASDLVVCMGGYNTICEVAALGKRAIVVPRVRPVEEQWIRSERLARLAVVRVEHPDSLRGERLAAGVLRELGAVAGPVGVLDLEALPRITRHVSRLLGNRERVANPGAAVSTSIARALAAAGAGHVRM